jgi:integrase
MATHRGHNDGTIYERTCTRKDGTKSTRYVAQSPIDFNGKRRQLGSFKTKTEAREALKQAQTAKAQGLRPSGKALTVQEWCETWLAGRTRIAYSTRAAYRASLPIMCSYIGHIRLEDLSEADIAVMWERLKDGQTPDSKDRIPLALTTLRKYHSHLKAALSSAVRSRQVPLNWNAAAGEEARPERGERKPINPLSEAEVRALFQASDDTPDHALFVTLVTTGVRHGEALALRWDDISFEHLRVSVQASLHRETGKGLQLGPTKTRKNRLVSLRPQAAAVLRRHKVHQTEMRLLAGPLWEDRGFVFTDGFGRPLDQTRIQRAFRQACSVADIEPRSVKELRHTFATLALIEGKHPKLVQMAMGHASIAITLDTYSHLVPNLEGDSFSHLDRLFG